MLVSLMLPSSVLSSKLNILVEMWPFLFIKRLPTSVFMPPPLGMDEQTPRYRDISRMTTGILIKFGMKVNCGVEMN